MKILFIFTNIGSVNLNFYPHQIGALIPFLGQAGHQASLIYLDRDVSRQGLQKMISEYDFDLIGISATTNQWPIVSKYPGWIKEKFPEKPIIVGGIHATMDPEGVIGTPGVDLLCRGEGELPLLKLIEALESGQDYSQIGSLWVKRLQGKSTVVTKNKIMGVIEDLNSLPWSDRKFLDYQKILFNRDTMLEGYNQQATIMAGRGCPFPCTYCCNNSLKNLYPNSQHYVRKRSIDHILAEAKYLIDNYHITSFEFEDDTFTLNKEWVKEFCGKYQRQIGLPFKAYIQAQTVDYETLELLKEAGLYEVNIGVECGNEKFRRKVLKRSMTNEDLQRVFGWLHELRIRPFAFMIIGYPNETVQNVAESMDLIRQLKPFHTQISVYYPYPGNELYAYCREHGLLTGRTKTTFFHGISTLKLEHITPKNLKKLYQQFWKLSNELRKNWLISEVENEKIKPVSADNKLTIIYPQAILQFFRKLSFATISFPLILLKKPYLIRKFFILLSNKGLYRAIQYFYDYAGTDINYINRVVDRSKILPHQFQPLGPNQSSIGSFRPKISIIVSVYNCPAAVIQQTIESVIDQSYQNWELCLVEGGSAPAYFDQDILAYYEAKDKRIKIKYLKDNLGLARNSNEALSLATGEYVAVLMASDQLAPNALLEVAKKLNESTAKPDLIYSDEDNSNLDGRLTRLVCKPGWSPDYLLHKNYVGHLLVVKNELIKAIGGFDPQAEGALYYDLLLRAAERTSSVCHIPEILYHRRLPFNLKVSLVNYGPYLNQAESRAVNRALARRQLDNPTILTKDKPKVSVIIPFRDNFQFTQKCLGSLIKKTAYRHYELIFVDNQSQKGTREKIIALLANYPIKAKICSFDAPFNFSAINNLAARQAEGKYLLFLNNDTEIIDEEWLSELLKPIQDKQVGVVGARLSFPNGKIQHCGITVSYEKIAENLYRGLPSERISKFDPRIDSVCNFSAVTGACLLVSKKIFNEVGGFDEALPNSYNDVDFCLKVKEKGYRIVYTSFARLCHHEAATRISLTDRQGQDYMRQKWGKQLENDPYATSFNV